MLPNTRTGSISKVKFGSLYRRPRGNLIIYSRVSSSLGDNQIVISPASCQYYIMATEATMAILPEDLLVAILGRLPSRSLMASRCVCKAWRDLVDGDRRLRRLLLPHYVRGLFINYQDYGRPHFFARPPASAADPRISGEFDFVPRKKRYGYYSSWYEVLDHCNGLVLFLETSGDLTYVCNPTTRRWTRLPPPPPCSGETGWWGRRVFLVFDPAVSPHYKVLLAPMEPTSEKSGVDRLMEWPPSPWTWPGGGRRRCL